MPPMPALRPMLATPGPLPTDGTGSQWAYEVKWDGVRCLAEAPGDGSLRLVTRAGNDATRTYPELTGLGERLRGRSAVLDGEVVVLDEAGRPDFGLLQRRMNVADARRSGRLLADHPVHLVLFDLLYLDGRPLLDAPYEERRDLLAGLELAAPEWSTPGHVVGQGAEVWETTRENGLEGVVAKRLGSRYTPGLRSADWRKTKHVRTLDVVIGGWWEGRGGITGLPGSVLAGVEEADGLRYAGSVGSGLSGRERHELARYFEVLARGTSPFTGPVDVPGAHWLEPRLVAEVGYSGWTAQGRLRHPTWHRLRPDLTRLD
ncbi:ATP-dependent DNA ligase [Streptomyces sp. Ru73]|uniref:non-homologous end-joining DNA ligase n=1 Tax=Streptomyces sp. Ru73 TaxID=2080748 RepID=UPI000CDE4758|nr:non-homologous end-joining DNA ligase [Streptomyces sp. Ru73]POX36368.1 ATP-dependent DNA ligase [Streptomyces sp. Ru73]